MEIIKRKKTLLFLTLCILATLLGCAERIYFMENSRNPILPQESLADPSMIFHDEKYYLYGTFTDGSIAGGSDHFDAYVSDDMYSWKKIPNIFTKEKSTTLWAPDVFFDPESKIFYLYYSNELNIGYATANSPIGPFEDKGTLIKGAIDAQMYYEKGEYFLYYASVEIENEYDMVYKKIKSLFLGKKHKAVESIWVQKMSSPFEKEGEPVLLLEPTIKWEQGFLLNVNEGPFVFKRNGLYYLMYSGNEAFTYKYAIGYATSNNPMGPFEKYENNPVARTSKKSAGSPRVVGPGHNSVIVDADGNHWIIYHQKNNVRDFGFSNRYASRDKIVFDESNHMRINLTPMTE